MTIPIHIIAAGKITAAGIYYQHIVNTQAKDALILVMGYAGSSKAWPQFMIEQLCKNYNLILFDNRGTGKSIKPENLEDYTIAKMAHDLIGVVEDLRLNEFFLLGWSLGGCIALELAHLMPNKVKKLVLMSTIGGQSLYVWPDKSLLQKLLYPQGETILDMFMDGWSVCLSPKSLIKYKIELTEIFESISPNFTPIEACRGQLTAYKEFEASHYLHTLKMPILVLSGTNDRLTPPENSICLAKAIGQGKAVLINDCEHMPHIEKRDEFFAVVESFFEAKG